MQSRLMLEHRPQRAVCVLLLLGAVAVGARTAHATDSDFAAKLCGILQKLLPEVRTYRPEGAQAQLVMALAREFDYDAAALGQVQTEIDPVTSASCPKDRDSMLTILKMKSLSEAVR